MLPTLFAAAALFLALVGIYGLLSYAVIQRTAEIGIRLALGASRSHVQAMVLQQGLKPVLMGSILGLTASIALPRLLSSYWFEVQALDPLTLLMVPHLLLPVAVAACLLASMDGLPASAL